ncbi:MAG: hypothetical protein EXX96DRAFT_578652 [Benjaminiella poitrasii]|nr:MAG: hypothetical protein EXX96DRAFT_578652 [Benjaminiella poitrasii]
MASAPIQSNSKTNSFLLNKQSINNTNNLRKFFNRFPHATKAPPNHPPHIITDSDSPTSCPVAGLMSPTTLSSSSSIDKDLIESPTQRQIDLVRISWERVSELRQETDDRNVSATHAFGLAFYDALFEMDDRCQDLFSNIFQQARALTGMISYIARAPKVTNSKSDTTIRDINAKKTEYDEGDPEWLALQMRELGARHYFYKVKPEHFELVGPAFVSALKKRLGEEYTDEIGEAWIKANSYAAYNMRIGFESQQAWEEGTNQQKHLKRNKASCTIQ